MQIRYPEIPFLKPVRLAKTKTYGNGVGEVLTKQASHMWPWRMFIGTTSGRIIWSRSINNRCKYPLTQQFHF